MKAAVVGGRGSERRTRDTPAASVPSVATREGLLVTWSEGTILSTQSPAAVVLAWKRTPWPLTTLIQLAVPLAVSSATNAEPS